MSDAKLTGGKVNYYLCRVDNPQRKEQAPYQAECEDIIRALGMDFDEGCEFKALWRTAAARQGNGKPGRSQTDQAIYDAEKRVHYANRSLRHYQFERLGQESAVLTEQLKLQEDQMKLAINAMKGSWIDWEGGDTLPVPNETFVEVVLRNGQKIGRSKAIYRAWAIRNCDDDIVKYRIVP
jgi:hypothetical protein